MKKCSAFDLDSILPQTQCGLCGYGGCMPYATAMVEENAPINLCPPGGLDTLKKIAALRQEDATPYLDDMRAKAKPPMLAVIRESECIGCTKCITACPVDAIIGAAKSMHVVITDECTGCELCVPPCPVDCIDMITKDVMPIAQEELKRRQYRARFERHNARQQKTTEKEHLPPKTIEIEQKKTAMQSYISAALARAKQK